MRHLRELRRQDAGLTDEGQRDIRVGLIGYGLAGSAFHAPIIDAVSGLRLAMVVTGDPARAAAARARYPAVEVVPAVDVLHARADELDLLVVASPNRTHVSLALAAFERGLHVVVDKPLAPTADEGRQLIAAADGAGRLLTVYQNRRWDADFLTLRRLLDEGALGNVLRFESRFERWRPAPKPGWRQSPSPDDAGGLLFDLGSHLIDQALVLFGPAREVYAELDVRRGAVDDDVFVAIRHGSRTRSHIWLNAMAARSGPRMRVLGSRAAWEKRGLDPQESALRAGRSPAESGWGEEPEEAWGLLGAGDEAHAVPSEMGDYPAFYRGVVRALRQGTPAPVDPGDAVRVLRVIEAARASAGSGGVIGLD